MTTSVQASRSWRAPVPMARAGDLSRGWTHGRDTPPASCAPPARRGRPPAGTSPQRRGCASAPDDNGSFRRRRYVPWAASSRWSQSRTEPPGTAPPAARHDAWDATKAAPQARPPSWLVTSMQLDVRSEGCGGKPDLARHPSVPLEVMLQNPPSGFDLTWSLKGTVAATGGRSVRAEGPWCPTPSGWGRGRRASASAADDAGTVP